MFYKVYVSEKIIQYLGNDNSIMQAAVELENTDIDKLIQDAESSMIRYNDGSFSFVYEINNYQSFILRIYQEKVFISDFIETGNKINGNIYC